MKKKKRNTKQKGRGEKYTGYLANATKLIDAVVRIASESKKVYSLQEGKELANELWTEIKKKEKIKVPREVDDIILSSVADVLKRKRKW